MMPWWLPSSENAERACILWIRYNILYNYIALYHLYIILFTSHVYIAYGFLTAKTITAREVMYVLHYILYTYVYILCVWTWRCVVCNYGPICKFNGQRRARAFYINCVSVYIYACSWCAGDRGGRRLIIIRCLEYINNVTNVIFTTLYYALLTVEMVKEG